MTKRAGSHLLDARMGVDVLRKARFFLGACEAGIALAAVGTFLVILQSPEADMFRNVTASMAVLFPIGMGTRYARYVARATYFGWKPGDRGTPGPLGIVGVAVVAVLHYLLAAALAIVVPRVLYPSYVADGGILLMWILAGCVGAAISLIYAAGCNFSPDGEKAEPAFGIVVRVANRPQA